jgi:hypothetical protein
MPPNRQGQLRLLAQAQEGDRHLPKPPAWTGAPRPLEDQSHRQSRAQALGHKMRGPPQRETALKLSLSGGTSQARSAFTETLSN